MLRRISRTYSFAATALSPIAHNADSRAGNEPLFRQTRVAQPDGSMAEVPVFSGNAFRGAVIRDPALDWLAELVELPENSLPPKLFHFLGAGGSIEKGETKTAFPVEKINRMRELLPMVGLLGGTWEATSIPGSFRSAFGWPVCAETTHLTDHLSETPARRLFDSPFFTRSGDETNPILLQVPGEKDHDPQMIYGAQMLAAGTRIVFQRMGVWRGTELELDLFEGLLAKWSEDPMLGGMTGKGCGKVAVEGFRPELLPAAGQAFVEHCRARRDDILGLLAEMGAVL